MSRALLVLWLTLVWVLLWGSPSVGNVLAGLLLGSALVVLVSPGPDRRAGVHPVAVLLSVIGGALVILACVLSARAMPKPAPALP